MGLLPFIKMHGLGNDFVIFDARFETIELTHEELRVVASRRMGIGCDQIITLEPSERADVFMRIHNADGGEVEACGNGTRCVAAHLMEEGEYNHLTIETLAGLLRVKRDGGSVSVDMGIARHEWNEIPLAAPADTLHLSLNVGSPEAPALADPVAINIGNPHVVFFVNDAVGTDLVRYGPEIEIHEMFPNRVNVSVAQVLDSTTLRVQVWERGVGLTAACGTAACAAFVAAARRGLVGGKGTVQLDGGVLKVEWHQDGHVIMTGPASLSFIGKVDLDELIKAKV